MLNAPGTISTRNEDAPTAYKLAGGFNVILFVAVRDCQNPLLHDRVTVEVDNITYGIVNELLSKLVTETMDASPFVIV